MKRVFAAAVLIAFAVAGSVSSAQPGGPGGQGAAMQSMRQAQMQDMSARMMRLQSQLQQLNQRMVSMQVHQGFKDLGAGMGQVCTGLQTMEKHMQQLREDPAFVQKQDRVRSMERLEDRARVMNREMEEAHEGLQRLVGMPARPGAPPDAAEQMIRAQHQQEIEQDQTRTDERLQGARVVVEGRRDPDPGARSHEGSAPDPRPRPSSLARLREALGGIRRSNSTVTGCARWIACGMSRVILREIEESANTLQSDIAA